MGGYFDAVPVAAPVAIPAEATRGACAALVFVCQQWNQVYDSPLQNKAKKTSCNSPAVCD